MSKVEMFSKFLTGIVEGSAIGHIFPEVAKKYAGHIFMQLPTATSVGLGVGIGVGIRIIDGLLSCGKLGKWMENHQFVKGLSSFAITQITGAVAAMALTAGSTGMIGVAMMVATTWLALKATDSVINYWITSSKEKAEFREFEKMVNAAEEYINPEEIFKKLKIDRLACFQNENKYTLYLKSKEVVVKQKDIEDGGFLANEMLDFISHDIKFNDTHLLDVKNNRYIKPLQDKIKKYKLQLEVFANFAAEDKKDVSGLFEDLSQHKGLENEVQNLREYSKEKLSQKGASHLVQGNIINI